MENNIRKDLASPRPFRQEQGAEKQTDLSACPSARGANRPVICPSACTLQIPITSRAAKAPGASREPVRSRSILCPAPVPCPTEPDPQPRQQRRDGTHGKPGWRSHWFPLGGFGLGFDLRWKPTAVHSSRLLPSTRSPSVAIPALAPTRWHRLCHQQSLRHGEEENGLFPG